MEKDLLNVTKQQQSKIEPSKCININIGVLGHVDSGKTSLCRVLSQVTSTASLDKHPQSQERGITLDLGFSAFLTRLSQKFTKQKQLKEEYLQFTLVDCPGHASLLRTIIGGAQIIDIMLLVIDITKGIQTQTAQCIIIAELFLDKIVVVLNKIDMLQDANQIQAKTNTLRKVFAKTKFGAGLTMIPISTKQNAQEHVQSLKHLILDTVQLPNRVVNKNFCLLIDHCFKIKGKGTIMTGTVIQGKIKPGEQIEICQIQQKGKVKSIEMFRKPLQSAKQGDRIAMLVTQIESEKIERGLACVPGSIKKVRKFVIDLNLIRLYKRPIKNKAKFHIISGHQTVMGEIRLFFNQSHQFDADSKYLLINQVQEGKLLEKTAEQKSQKISEVEQQTVNFKEEKVQSQSQAKIQSQNHNLEPIKQQVKQTAVNKPDTVTSVYMVITLQKYMYLTKNNQVVGYKFDVDIEQKMCRIAFHGKIRHIITQDPKTQLKFYKNKEKTGVVDRLHDNYTIIVKDLFDKKFLDIKEFVGKMLQIDGYDAQKGRIQGTFGKSGKVRVTFKNVIEIQDIQGRQVRMAYIKQYN